MISQVQFANFKALAQVRIDLERLTVLVGANATGKTTVLDGLDILARLATSQPGAKDAHLGRIGQVFRGRFAHAKLRTIGAAERTSLVVLGDLPRRYQVDLLELAGKANPEFQVSADDLGTFSAATPPESSERFFQLLGKIGFGPAVRLQLDPTRLSEPSYVEDERPRVGSDGLGLASVLALARGEQSEAITRIEADLRRIVPRAKRIRTFPARIQRTEHEVITVNGSALSQSVERTYMGQRFELELDGIGSVPADMLSEGTLLVLGLLTVLHTTPGLKLLLLDDLDRGLHPNAQREVIQSIRAVLGENPQLQVVCTTHSPYALGIFRPEEVRVMKLDAHGRAHCKALTEHPDWPRWRDFMGAGEFWSSVGEDWVYGEEHGG